MLDKIIGKAIAKMRLFGCAMVVSGMLVIPLAAHAGVAILQYHHIGDDTPRVTSVTAAELQQHLEYLLEHDFTVLDLSTISTMLAEGKALPPRAAAITIDDGWRNVYDNGKALFAKYKLPFTIFVNPKLMREAPHLYMSWEQLRELQQYGAVIANHSQSHEHMTRRLPGETEAQWQQRQLHEILAAQQEIDTALAGPQPRLFAYPYGEFDPTLQQLLEQHDFIAFGQHSGVWGPLTPTTAIPRFPAAGQYANLTTLATKLLSLPLPVLSAQPQSMIVAHEQLRPTITVNLANLEDFSSSQLNCFYAGEVLVPQWQQQSFSLTLPVDLPIGRSRVNCTVPSRSQAGRFYWYSQPLVRPDAQGSWPD
ncbi:MAG: Uncharacterised protein [Pseudidiomarina mangrovi]|nr:MAG: Uncharacterised protein [Pseudidiomarina mangrovi]